MNCRRTIHAAFAAALLSLAPLSAADLPRIVVAKDPKSFATADGKAFVPWGFNYDRDAKGRLLEDYWHDEWPKVERDFRAMKALGANVVRIHLQTGKFLDAADSPNNNALNQLAKLVKLAEDVGLYLDLTGLGCYHKADVPAWYDKLSEADRWKTQVTFWKAVAETCAKSPAIFCYDLMNEPVVPGALRKDWLGPAFAGKHFVQFVALDPAGRKRPDVARDWIRHLAAAIREKDQQTLTTVGLVDWSLEKPGLTSGFVPKSVAGELDFLCVHLYPEAGKVDAAIETLKGFAAGKPVLIEETFSLKCGTKELGTFFDQAGPHAAGALGFFWGQTPDDLKDAKTIGDALTRDWLELFRTRGKFR